MEPLGSSPDGLFQFVNEQTNRSSEKWGWVARQPGAAVTFTLDTRTRRQEGEEAQWGEVGGPGGLPGALAAGADGAGGEEGGEVDGDGEEEEALGWGQVSQGGGSAGSGAAGGAEAAAGPRERVKVLVGYLKSYEHMGTAEVACTSGCRWVGVGGGVGVGISVIGFGFAVESWQAAGAMARQRGCSLGWLALQAAVPPPATP